MTCSKLKLYSRLQHAAHVLKKTADRELISAAGLSTAQAAVLALVNTQKKISQRDVAGELGFNESAVTAMVARMIKLDFISRLPNENDKRAKLLSLTTDGEAALKRAAVPFSAINARLDEALGKDDIETLARSLDQISDTFGD